VLLKEGYSESPELIGELRNEARHHIGPIATPDVILIAPGLPKSRSGKIMRRILRKIAADETENLGDITTLADPDVVQQLLKRRLALQV
jgi:acetyl-CoA synthetase